MKKLLVLMLLALLLLPALAAHAFAQPRQGKHIAEGLDFIVAVQSDGTVKAIGENSYGQCDTGAWRDVVAVSAGYNHTLGLKKDGTVYAAGDNSDGQCNVQGWKDIVMVAASFRYSFGLTREGKVLSTINRPSRYKSEVESWQDIAWTDGLVFHLPCAVDVSGVPHVAGVNVSGLQDVRQLYDTEDHLYVLKNDGTVQFTTCIEDEPGVYAEDPVWKEMDRNIFAGVIELESEGWELGALTGDGKVIANGSLRKEAEGWTKIAEIEGGFGVRADGSVIFDMEVTRDYSWEQLEQVLDWKVMVDPDRLKALKVDDMARDNPALPRDELTTAGGIALKAQAVGFEPGSKYAVYTGPGREYLRAGNGTALVSTGEKLLLYGADHGWVLIQYAVSKDKLCFGYIPLITLPKRYMDMRLLPPVNLKGQAEAASVLRDTFLTDDPNASREALLSLKAGQKGVLLLGTLNNAWAYVQAAYDKGTPLRGFVPASDIAGTGQAALQSYTVPKGVVKLYREGSKSPGWYNSAEMYDVIPQNARAVVLPASAEELGALIGLAQLRSIQAPPDHASFKSIDGVLFSKDGKRLLLYPAGKGDKEYRIPEGTEQIVIDCGLQYATSLETLYLPASLNIMPGEEALANVHNFVVSRDHPDFADIDGVLFNKKLDTLILYPHGRTQTEYALPEGTARFVANGPFTMADDLKALVLPSTFDSFDPFFSFPTLERIQVSEQNPLFRSIDGVLFSKDGTKLLFYPFARLGDTYTVPPGTREVSFGAFHQGTRYIRHVILPDGLQVIDGGAFENCETLQSVYIPDGVKVIGTSAFENCSHLTTVNIPSSLAIIEVGAFRWSGLSGTLKIPEGVISIQDEVFVGVHGLTDLYLPASLQYMDIWANLILNAHSDPSDVTIHAPAGSYAAKIAQEAWYDLVIEER